MSTFYFDTSALVKLYVPEAGSKWVDSTVNALDGTGRPRHVVALSDVGLVEVSAAVARREREGTLDAESAEFVRSRFAADCHGRFFALAVRRDVILRAMDIARRRELRAYDALHLATALVLSETLGLASIEPPTFVSADEALNRAAEMEGLSVEFPI